MKKTASFLTVERLWQFSLQYYAMRGVKEACLSLQNNFNGNVNLLLLLKWLDEQQLIFDRNDWNQVQQALLRTETLLLHYRHLRKKTKSHLPATLYRESLEFELLLEKQQQSDLVECINILELTPNNKEPLALAYCRSLNAEHLFTATFAKHSANTSS
ncbi:TIGR02444 family protein [Vibrio sp. TH_r3]|uniref:TIGR02444 family protein n=1 Tax=Vibrio sp. TH_r3 TaxID=3082084 RepID=UPI002954BD3C|nr:TIGR02444 family protein [Vibrio sp. TH_r3]MDV7105441.1 TIGR02444 family protein [Vibrio sp. TH_r3]